MAPRHSTAPASAGKTPPGKKPKPDFPLSWHPRGGWCKKIGGHKHYFGKDPDRALRQWLHDEPFLRAGKVPPDLPGTDDYLSVERLCNLFLVFKESRVESGELTRRAFNDYFRICKRLRTVFGPARAVDHLQPADFGELRDSMTKTMGSVAICNEITRTRVVFKWAYENGHIEKPVRYGQGFARPKAKTLRLERAAKGAAIYTRDEYLLLLSTADTQFRAMMFLGLNAGMGPADIGLTKLSEINLTDGWLRTFRNKTGISRAAWLWPETSEALREWIDKREKWLKRRKAPLATPEVAELLFVTKYGDCWHKEVRGTPISYEFRKLMKKAGVAARKGVNFYSLRRCVETYGGEARDQVAVDYVMGHVDSTMGGVYRQGISDARVKAVCEAVRSWLYGGELAG